MTARSCTTRIGRSLPRDSARCCRYDRLDKPGAVSRQDLSRATHCRLSGGLRLPLSLHVLRRGGDVRGKTALPPAARLEQDLGFLKHQLGVDAIQFYDHNFFDREVDMVPLLEVLARFELPWWCFARSDALLNLSERSWALVRKSGLRMAYIGAESPSDWLLHDIRKGTRADQTTGGRGEMPQPRRHPGAVVHAGAAAGSRGRDREDVRVHPR